MNYIFNLNISDNRFLCIPRIVFLDIGKYRIPNIIMSRLIYQFLKWTFILRLIVIQPAVVKIFPNFSPIRHISVHVCNKDRIMLPSNQMCQLMQNYIIQTDHRFLSQLQIKP